jgi:hypothetical protein
LIRCSSFPNDEQHGCIGMPSGHAETVTILSSLLYLYDFIPLWLCLILIIGVSGERVISNIHTLPQVLVGIFLGYMYALLYYSFNFSIYSGLIVLIIGSILALLSIYPVGV